MGKGDDKSDVRKKLPDHEGVFDVVLVTPRKLQTGNKVKVVLETTYSSPEFAALAPYFNEKAKVYFEHYIEQPELDLKKKTAEQPAAS